MGDGDTEAVFGAGVVGQLAMASARMQGAGRVLAVDNNRNRLEWAVAALAKAGTLGVIGVYPMSAASFPIGAAMNKNLIVNMGNCNHRRYLPKLIDLVASGFIDLSPNLTQDEPLAGIVEAYRSFDRREPGWVRVKISA